MAQAAADADPVRERLAGEGRDHSVPEGRKLAEKACRGVAGDREACTRAFGAELGDNRRNEARRSLDDERDLRCPDRSRRDRAQVQHPCDERVRRGAGERPAREDESGHRQPESDAPCFAAAPEDRAAVPLPGAEDQRSGRTLRSEPADRDRLPRHGDPERLGELARRPAVVAHPQPRDRLRVPARVAGGRAKRDDRLAAHQCLEARDTGGRMDDCVGRGHQLVHVVRETEDAARAARRRSPFRAACGSGRSGRSCRPRSNPPARARRAPRARACRRPSRRRKPG